MSPAAVSIAQLEPVVYLRGQSAAGEDARGRRRPINVDAPPSQLRGLITVYLPKPCKVREISVSLTGTARTDWPEGIGPNRLELVEEVTIFKQTTTLFDAKVEGSVPGRRRSNSVGPGIGLNDEFDWDSAAAASAGVSGGQQRDPSTAGASSSSRSPAAARKEETTNTGSNLARQLAGAAAKAGTAIIPPTLRPDLNASKSKGAATKAPARPALNRTGSGTASWADQGNAASGASSRSPPLQPPSPLASSATPRAPQEGLGSFSELFARRDLQSPAREGFPAASPPNGAVATSAQRWSAYLEPPSSDRPPGYAPRSAPLFDYDGWPSTTTVDELPNATSPSSEIGSPVWMPTSSAPWTEGGSGSRDAYPAASRDSTAPSSPTMSRTPSAAPGRSILTGQTLSPRAKEQTVRFDHPPPPLGPAAGPSSAAATATSVSTAASASSLVPGPQSTPSPVRSSPASRRNSAEVSERDKTSVSSKLKQASKGAGEPGKGKKSGLKGLIGGLLKEHEPKAEEDVGAAAESKEFKKGTYTFPVCISLPSNLPPTLHADFGFTKYVLKAVVYRSGALTPNLVAEREIKLIHAPDEDALDETDSIVVERTWEDVLSYMVVFSGKSFPFGRKIPLWLKFVPQGKVRIHKITAMLEERTDYFAKGRRVARHEVPRKWTLLKVANEGSGEPLLPIMSDSAEALQRSPLAALAEAAAGDDPDSEALPSIMDPHGPWELAADLDLPDHSTTRINLSTNHAKSNIAVHHLVRVMIRVEKPDGVADGTQAAAAPVKDDRKHKLYDIIIEAPITLTSVHTADEWMNLPNYWSLTPDDAGPDPLDAAAAQPDVPSRRPLASPPGVPRAIPRPSMPSPVNSGSGRLGPSLGIGGRPPSPLSHRSAPARDRSDPSAGAATPQRLSQRWLALSSTVGNAAGTTRARDPPPPAYEAEARQGEAVIASTRLADAPSSSDAAAAASSAQGAGAGAGASAAAAVH
ncbi:related to ALY2 - alpha arrestin [Pseudozyma flocculosa]|uniref:Related to ALY2 - alpha arrestin n=1 Tax=Pseudozyma flocculosa TaxID=84751 RepID=A0A5C3F1F7_9BASI|nr:related to ALY2 - alpha arrestin [Pseudozyma flocculosa]